MTDQTTLPTTFKCEVFSAGTQTDAAGNTREWTVEDLKTIAQNFNEQDARDRIDAPATIGHPEDNLPAWGWVEKLWVEGDVLWAEFKDVQPEFMELLDRKMFTSRSISLYVDSLRLRHVAFLGAAQPAVKGLAPLEFKAAGSIASFALQDVPAVIAPNDPGSMTLDEIKAAQEERAKTYGIAVKETAIGSTTKPAGFADVADEKFADPVHYRFPFATEAQLRASMRLFNFWDVSNVYSESERQVILTKLIGAAMEFGIDLEKTYLFNEGGNNSGKSVREERALKYSLPVLADKGHDTIPSEYADLKEEDFADPVNLRFPLSNRVLAATIATWGRDVVRKDYSEQEQATISARIIVKAVSEGYNLTSHAWATRDGYSDHVDVPPDILTRKQLIDVVNGGKGAARVDNKQTSPSTTNYGGSSMNEELFKQFLEELSTKVSEAYGESVASGVAGFANDLKDKYMQLAADATGAPAGGVDPNGTPSNNAEVTALNKRIAQLEFNERRTDFSAYAEKMIGEGRILPKQKEQLVSLLEGAHSRGEISFSEGSEVKKDSMTNILKTFVSSLEPSVSFGEKDKSGAAGKPSGDTEDDRLALHNRITEYRETQAKAGRELSYQLALIELEEKGLL